MTTAQSQSLEASIKKRKMFEALLVILINAEEEGFRDTAANKLISRALRLFHNGDLDGLKAIAYLIEHQETP